MALGNAAPLLALCLFVCLYLCMFLIYLLSLRGRRRMAWPLKLGPLVCISVYFYVSHVFTTTDLIIAALPLHLTRLLSLHMELLSTQTLCK